MSNQYPLIMGKNCLQEVIKAQPERIVEVYTYHENDPILKGLRVKKRSKQELTKMVQSESHQGYVAAVKDRHYAELNFDANLIVILDSILDPQNVGSILRACECFGADQVVYSKNRGAKITPVVTKVSVGASELVPIVKVSNLAETCRKLQKHGFYVIAADAGPGSESIYSFEFPEKVVLILGSEGEGVQPLLLKTADTRLRIPMQGKIDSLNVAQAAAVFLGFVRSLKTC